MSPTDMLVKLCNGVQALRSTSSAGPGIEIQFKPSEFESDKWSVVVIAGAVILFNTDFGQLDEVLDQACKKIASMSTKMMAAVMQSSPPPPPDTEKEK